MDKFSYTFSPIGEFWLILHPNLNLQMRTIQAWDVNQQLAPGGSVVGGLVAEVPGTSVILGSSVICVLMNANRNGKSDVWYWKLIFCVIMMCVSST